MAPSATNAELLLTIQRTAALVDTLVAVGNGWESNFYATVSTNKRTHCANEKVFTSIQTAAVATNGRQMEYACVLSPSHEITIRHTQERVHSDGWAAAAAAHCVRFGHIQLQRSQRCANAARPGESCTDSNDICLVAVR